MDQQMLTAILIGLLSVVIGAVIGGGTVAIVYGRAIKSVLESPVIMTSLEQLAKSWPAPVREAVANTGKFLEEVADDKPASAVTVGPGSLTRTTSTPPPPQQITVSVPPVGVNPPFPLPPGA